MTGGREGTRGDRLSARLGAIVQQMPTAAIVAEAPAGRVVLANRRAEDILRRPLSRADGQEPWQALHADGRPYGWADSPLMRSIRTGEVVEGEEIEIVRGDGTRAVLCVSASPVVDEAGRIIAGVATFSDVTEQKRAETARQFLSGAGAVLGSSLDYQTTLRNLARLAVPALADWCSVDVLAPGGRIERLAVEHVDPDRAAVARELALRYPPDPDAPAGLARVLRTGEPELIPEVGDDVLRGVAQDEEHLRALRGLGLRSAILVPLVARGKTLGGIALITAESGRCYGPRDLELARELAARAALAIDNARLYHQSLSANRAKSDFLAVMSHELRTPLTAIIGYAELLDLGIPEPLTERQREQVQRIELSARELQQLIEEILTVASLEAGQGRVGRQRVEVGELLRRAEAIIRPMATAKGLALDVEAAEGVVLETDPDKLLQVLLSLLSNAVKFTEEGEVGVRARASGDFAEITVWDTGIGIDARHQEQIFDPFWQVEQPATRRAGGTGLGLTIARRLMDLLGGEIRVRSEVGRGSVFRARIPLRMPA